MLPSRFRILTREERREAALLTISMIANAFLGLVGLAGLLPFIQLMLEPDPLAGNRYLAIAFRSLGIQHVDDAILISGLALLLMVLLKNVYAFLHLGLQNYFSARWETRVASEMLRSTRPCSVYMARTAQQFAATRCRSRIDHRMVSRR